MADELWALTVNHPQHRLVREFHPRDDVASMLVDCNVATNMQEAYKMLDEAVAANSTITIPKSDNNYDATLALSR